jgi:hypothetical protein
MIEPVAIPYRVMTQHEIDARMKPILDEIIGFHEDYYRPFRRADWMVALAAGELTWLDPDIQQALNAAISEVLPATAFAVPVELLTLEDTVEFAKTELPVCDGEEQLTFDGPEIKRVQLFDYALFDSSKRWAVISNHEDYTIIGGDAAFMSAFASRIEGGLDALKRRFIEYCDEWYPSVEFRKKVLAGVGWADAWQPKE